jgi:hypothetical protein
MPDGPKLSSPWNEFLTEINDRLTAPVQLVCIGGFVVTTIHGLSRSTGDLDLLTALPVQLREELQHLGGRNSELHRNYHLFVDYVAVVTMPINFEDRLTEAPFQFSKVRLLIPEIYDLVLSKLERNSPKDYQDVEYLAKKYKLSFATLRKRFDEELDFIPNRKWHEQTLESFWQEWFCD